ncbi:MAG TPA: ABC transporter substrate-binding protein [Methylomirabilota bacterium]|jgi:putative ABC transport system substrate-binding protein|nr:ABC transporter substrate-binding protein [Methylomirabilota bacterium]
MLGLPLSAAAQQSGRLPTIAIAGAPTSASDQHLWRAFRDGLRDLGYVEGRTLAIEWRGAPSQEVYGRIMRELVGRKPDLIVAPNSAAATAAKRATHSIPIVMISGDPIADGLVTSLTRPDGNVTGLSTLASDILGKQLQLLKEAVPKVSRVAILSNPGNPFHAAQVGEATGAARSLGMEPRTVEARGHKDLDAAFVAMRSAKADALLVLSDGPVFFANRARIADLAASRRLPAMYSRRDHVEAGGLMAYGTDRRDVFRRLAVYVDKILKGAKPADLPVEQPTRFELLVNLKAANALGLTLPPSLLARVDEVIR